MPPRTHVVLGGGGAMGAFQAGALLALTADGIVPDTLHGCSAGALNAAFFASRPDPERARELTNWWLDREVGAVLSPGWRSHARAAAGMVRGARRGLIDAGPLSRLIARNVHAHDLSELALPVVVTTTCLDCAAPRQHDRGPVVDVLLASCALPGLFEPVRLPDGHLHVDGGITDGVPIAAALAGAGPDDRVLVLDCGLSAITASPGRCAGSGEPVLADACGVPVVSGRTPYVAAEETTFAAFDVLLRAFAVARDVANRAAIADALIDPRVEIAPHIADAWAGGLLDRLPAGPRDMSCAADLVRAGRLATAQWLRASRRDVSSREPSPPAR